MLRIRLQRKGRRNAPKFRIVITEKTTSVRGKFIEIVGYYIPGNKKVFECNKEKIVSWIQKGAKPTETVARLLKNAGMEDMDKFIRPRVMKPTRVEREKKKALEEGGEKKEDKPVIESAGKKPEAKADETPKEEEKDKETEKPEDKP